MFIDKIRNSFSKGSVVVSGKNISVVYSDQDWVTQTFKDSNKDLFSDLINSSGKVSIILKKGNSVRYGFINGDGDQRVIYYSPLERDTLREDLDKLMNDFKPDKEFLEFIDGLDFNNEIETVNKMSEWIDRINNKNRIKVHELNKFKAWPEFKHKALLFAKKYACDTDIIEPDDISDGNITIQIPDIFNKPIIILDEWKNMLVSLIDMSGLVDLEMNPAEGYLNIVLYQ